MKTKHNIFIGDSRSRLPIEDQSVELVVTSPPYPMVEMWDETFVSMNDSISPLLDDGDGKTAFDLMHHELDKVWAELSRVLASGGICCINIGDATRSIGPSFQVYPNYARVLQWFMDSPVFEILPGVIWHKPTNKATKFMGSGMLPSNAYVTMERENILIVRKGTGTRTFHNKEVRRESAYFWEERNVWFSDLWTDVYGTSQTITTDTRDRSGSYPIDIPLRLILMYSIYGDTVLDPFLGVGTTTRAAMLSGRNSIGIEIDPEITRLATEELCEQPICEQGEELIDYRLSRHKNSDISENYPASNFDFSVVTKGETEMQLYVPTKVAQTQSEGSVSFSVTHTPVGHKNNS